MRRWIKDRLKELGKTQVGLAAALGLPHTRINEMIKGKRELQTREISTFAKFLEMSEQGVISAFSGSDTDNFTLNVGPPVRLDKSAPVKGEVAAGVWLEHEFMDDDKYPPVAASTNPRYSDIEQYALRVKGDSMDKYVKDGDHVICIDFAATGEAVPEDNKVVVVRRERAGTIEHSLKRVRRLGNGDYELWPESNNPLFQKPLDMAHNDAGTTVIITGLVIGRVMND